MTENTGLVFWGRITWHQLDKCADNSRIYPKNPDCKINPHNLVINARKMRVCYLTGPLAFSRLASIQILTDHIGHVRSELWIRGIVSSLEPFSAVCDHQATGAASAAASLPERDTSHLSSCSVALEHRALPMALWRAKPFLNYMGNTGLADGLILKRY